MLFQIFGVFFLKLSTHYVFTYLSLCESKQIKNAIASWFKFQIYSLRSLVRFASASIKWKSKKQFRFCMHTTCSNWWPSSAESVRGRASQLYLLSVRYIFKMGVNDSNMGSGPYVLISWLPFSILNQGLCISQGS